jgi:hypothetical protein
VWGEARRQRGVGWNLNNDEGIENDRYPTVSLPPPIIGTPIPTPKCTSFPLSQASIPSLPQRLAVPSVRLDLLCPLTYLK